MRVHALALVALGAALAACGAVRPPHPIRQEASPLIARGPTPHVGHAATGAKEPADDLACVVHPRIDGWENRLREARGIETLLARGAEVAPLLRPILVEEGVSPALAMLPAIESSFRTDALSTHGARGLWQLKPATARELGLVVDKRRDDRLHVERSTRAAAAMLRRLYRRYGEWTLALAAYHAGEGTVDRALARSGGETTFWALADAGRLPAASADYVPRVLAIVRLAEDGCRSDRGVTAVADRDR